MYKNLFILVEIFLKHEGGLTREEVNKKLIEEGEEPFARMGFVKAVSTIQAKTGIKIQSHNCGKNVWKYSIDRHALEDYDREQLLGNLLANMIQAVFLQEFRDLGSKIQPLIIARGTEYLRPIGNALRKNLKLNVTYQKFGEEPYDTILHPYCLKVFGGRWYLFAFKENSDHPEARVQCFSLDRIKAISVSDTCFEPDLSVDPQEYFRDAFGIWVDNNGHPAEDIIVACTKNVANYLRSLPLHHSQREIEMEPSSDRPDLAFHFAYHFSVTPDFVGELNRWGDECVLLRS